MELDKENVELRKRNIQLLIQHSILINQFQSYVARIDTTIKHLSRQIPSKAMVKEWVREENDYERKKMQGLRDEAIAALTKIKEVYHGGS